MTADRTHPDPLNCMYGAVAAVERDDREGVDVLLRDLYESFEDFTALLTTMSLVTLERLDAALALGDPASHPLSAEDSLALAAQLLEDAAAYDITGPIGVHTAAQRLDIVRRFDAARMALEVRAARSMASDAELLYGAVALLAATVAAWADRTGRARERAISDLCLASCATTR